MNNIITALIIVLSLNALMMISQNAITEMDPGSTRFYTGQGGILDNHAINSTDTYTDLPSSGASVQGDNNNFFTDVVGTILSWIGKVPGFNTIIQTVKAPYNFLKVMGLPPMLTDILGSLWYLITLSLLFLVITGRY